jgi:hypothetical protein
MRHRELHQRDLLALDVGELLALSLEEDGVVAARIVAENDDGRVNATRRGNGQGIHIGVSDGVELASRVLVDRLDVVVDLREFDLNLVLVGPLLQDSRLLRIEPRHIPGVDRPRELERRRIGRHRLRHGRGPQQQRRAGDHQRFTQRSSQHGRILSVRWVV